MNILLAIKSHISCVIYNLFSILLAGCVHRSLVLKGINYYIQQLPNGSGLITIAICYYYSSFFFCILLYSQSLAWLL